MKLRSDDCEDLKMWLKRKRAYTTHEIQNEILRLMAHQIVRSIIKDASSTMWYSIMADETVDAFLV